MPLAFRTVAALERTKEVLRNSVPLVQRVPPRGAEAAHVTLLVHDAEVGQTLHDRFLQDLDLARELDLDTFRERPRHELVKARFWVLFSRFL